MKLHSQTSPQFVIWFSTLHSLPLYPGSIYSIRTMNFAQIQRITGRDPVAPGWTDARGHKTLKYNFSPFRCTVRLFAHINSSRALASWWSWKSPTLLVRIASFLGLAFENVIVLSGTRLMSLGRAMQPETLVNLHSYVWCIKPLNRLHSR